MSVDFLKKVLTGIKCMDSLSVQLLRVTNNRKGTVYYARQIQIHPEKELYEYIESMCDGINVVVEKTEGIDDYCGDIVKGCIYKLSIHNDMILDYYDSLLNATSNPSIEGDVIKQNWNALLLKGYIKIDGTEKEIMLVSMKSPVSILKNKFVISERNCFTKLDKPMLTLNKNIDAIIVDNTLYMLTMQAENLFNMERSYRKRCETKVDEIIKLGILTNSDSFNKIATHGQNPRRFVTFNQGRLDAIKNPNSREKYMQMFRINMKNNRIDTEDEKSAERLVKFLCEKAMLDPIDEEPREVSAAKAWS